MLTNVGCTLFLVVGAQIQNPYFAATWSSKEQSMKLQIRDLKSKQLLTASVMFNIHVELCNANRKFHYIMTDVCSRLKFLVSTVRSTNNQISIQNVISLINFRCYLMQDFEVQTHHLRTQQKQTLPSNTQQSLFKLVLIILACVSMPFLQLLIALFSPCSPFTLTFCYHH